MKAIRAFIGACIASVALVGCGSEHGMHYQVFIDTSLSPAQVDDVIAGGSAWENAVPGLTLDYSITSCTGYDNWPHTICIFIDNSVPEADSTYHVLPAATTDWSHGILASPTSVSADSATVHVWAVTLTHISEPYTFYNALTHELGHAMTHRGSHIGAGNLMFGEENGNVVEQITSDDVDYFWSTR